MANLPNGILLATAPTSVGNSPMVVAPENFFCGCDETPYSPPATTGRKATHTWANNTATRPNKFKVTIKGKTYESVIENVVIPSTPTASSIQDLKNALTNIFGGVSNLTGGQATITVTSSANSLEINILSEAKYLPVSIEFDGTVRNFN